MAVEGLYCPLWAEVILDEPEFHEAPSSNGASTFRRRPKRLVRGWSGRCASTSGDAMVTGWEPLEGTFSLPDPDDEHVVAAAVVGGTGVIVTLNRKDFPRDRVPGHIQVISPDRVCGRTASVSPAAAARAVEMFATRLRQDRWISAGTPFGCSRVTGRRNGHRAP